MTHERKSPIEHIVARRTGATWREHVIGSSIEPQEPDVSVVWSRLWLRPRAGVSNRRLATDR